jgi:hypothetical protein
MSRARLLRTIALTTAVLAGVLAGSIPAYAAAEKTAAELLPTSTLVYMEIRQPGKLIDAILDHPVARKLQGSPELQKAMGEPKVRELLSIISEVERRVGMQWQAALNAAAGDGVVVAFEAWTQGVVGLVRSKDRDAAARLRDAVFALLRQDAADKGMPDPIRTIEQRGLTMHEVNDVSIAQLGAWLALSNKPQLVRSIADRVDADDAAPTLAEDEGFQQARALAAGNGGAVPDAWAMVRLTPLRLLGVAKQLLNNTEKSDEPAAELLAGGILSAMNQAPFVTSSFTVGADDDAVRLTVAAPFDRAWVGPERRFYFGEDDDGAAQPLKPRGTMLSVTAYRDLSAFWQAGPDLFGEGVAAKMARTDSELSVFFGGRSFGAHVLGALGPQVQLVVAAQDYKAAGVVEPAIRFPAGALVVHLRKDAPVMQRRLRVAFQSLVALANLDGAQKGRPLLEMGTEKRSDSEIHYAMYESGDEDGDAATMMMKPGGAEDVYMNFSPSLVVADEYAMLCSTRQIARDLAELVAKRKDAGGATLRENALIEADARVIADVLRQNRGQLVAQNMLEKGHDQAAAEREIDTLLSLLGLVRDASVRLTPTDNALTLEFQVRAANVE